MGRIAADVALDVDFARRWIVELSVAIESECELLTRLDSAVGDADHGVNMLRGLRAVVAALAEAEPETPAAVLGLVGSRLMSVVGGAAGPLYGMAFRSMGEAMGEMPVGLPELSLAVTAGLAGIQRLGAAVPGDKTIVDAWTPAADALADAVRSGSSVRQALDDAELAAREGMDATIPMRARKGRASYLGWRSEGHQDPGATSTHIIFSSMVSAAS